jgi:hypothetical protein
MDEFLKLKQKLEFACHYIYDATELARIAYSWSSLAFETPLDAFAMEQVDQEAYAHPNFNYLQQPSNADYPHPGFQLMDCTEPVGSQRESGYRNLYDALQAAHPGSRPGSLRKKKQHLDLKDEAAKRDSREIVPSRHGQADPYVLDDELSSLNLARSPGEHMDFDQASYEGDHVNDCESVFRHVDWN